MSESHRADDSLARYARRVAGGDREAEAALIDRLGPLVPTLFAIVRRRRPDNVARRVQSTGVVYEALFGLVEWLRQQGSDARLGADDVRRMLCCLTRRTLLDQVRWARQKSRDVAREQPSDEGQPRGVADRSVPATDLPGSVVRAIQDSSAADAPPGKAGEGPGNPHLARAAGELVSWLENWGDELRSVHPKAIEIIEWSFCGWGTEQIGQILNIPRRTVQWIKQRLLPVVEDKLGLGGETDGD